MAPLDLDVLERLHQDYVRSAGNDSTYLAWCDVNTALTKAAVEQLPALIAELRAMRALVPRLRARAQDATRYRWLRDVGDRTWLPLLARDKVKSRKQVDAAIDAAIAKGEPT